MIRINSIKLSVKEAYDKNGKPNMDLLMQMAIRLLKSQPGMIRKIRIAKRSIDARKKPNVFVLYNLEVYTDLDEKKEQALVKRLNHKDIIIDHQAVYLTPEHGKDELHHPPCIIGMGPAGLFAGYELAKKGFKPIIIEQGGPVEDRQKDIDEFWKSGRLNPNSNVQFGEGGAGTFSDGKLNTMTKDKLGLIPYVLNTFVAFGGPEEILYDYKPHLGTDLLCQIVSNIRKEIIRLGGQVHFNTKVIGFTIKDRKIQRINCENELCFECDQVILAIGHSSRDMFYHLYDQGVQMEQKDFAIGFRVEHNQKLINFDQYGMEDAGFLGAAPYKLTHQALNGRNVYSFCMCPGGYVVNASSEEGRLCVNGMSYSKRDSQNANSAIVMNVTGKDFPSNHPLAGIVFQRELEQKAYEIGRGKVPVQCFGDFERIYRQSIQAFGCEEAVNQVSTEDEPYRNSDLPDGELCKYPVSPMIKGEYLSADLTTLLPNELNEAFIDGMHSFGRKIKGFDAPNVCIDGLESRTSSPVRIPRDSDTLVSVSISNLYPCGEGAGYAGGITSAAMDGIRVAAKIISRYNPIPL